MRSPRSGAEHVEGAKWLDTARVEDTISGIKPDGKAQVSVCYDDTGTPVKAETVVVSVQNEAGKDLATLTTKS